MKRTIAIVTAAVAMLAASAIAATRHNNAPLLTVPQHSITCYTHCYPSGLCMTNCF